MNPTTSRLARVFAPQPPAGQPRGPVLDIDLVVNTLLASLAEEDRLDLTFDPDPGIGRGVGALAVRAGESTVVIPRVSRAFFRAALARVSAVMAQHLATGIDPYGAAGDVRLRVLDTGMKVHIEFHNTPDRQELHLTRVAKRELRTPPHGASAPNGNGSYNFVIEVPHPAS